MKKWVKILSKVGLFGGVPSILVGTTIGVVVGFDSKDISFKISKPVSVGERYFDNVLVKSEVELNNNVFYPSADDHNLLFDYVQLNEKFMDNNSIKGMIKGWDPKTTKPIKSIDVQFSAFSKYSEIQNKFKSINNELYKFKQDNPKKRYGIYWTSIPFYRKIKIEVYELNTNVQDQTFINDYISQLEKIKKKNIWPQDIDFARIQASEIQANSTTLGHNYPFKELIGMGINNANDKLSFSTESEKIIDGKFTLTGDNGEKLKYRVLNNHSDKFGTPNISLLKKDFFTTVIPMVDYGDSTHKAKLRLLFKSYKIDKLKSTINITKTIDNVLNPANVYLNEIDFSLKELFLHTPHFDKNQPNRIPEDADIGNLKTSKTQTPDLGWINNRALVVERLSNAWMKFIDLPLSRPGLNLLGSLMPSINATVIGFVQTLQILNRLKAQSIEYHGKKMNALNIILDAPMYDSADKAIPGSVVANQIIDTINKSDFLQSEVFWNTAFRDFTVEKDSKWTKLDTFVSLSNDKTTDGSPSNERAVYHFVAGFNLLNKIIKKRINELSKIDVIPKNLYEDFETSHLIDELLNLLKIRDIISRDISINDIIADPKKYIAIILKGLKNNKGFPLKGEYFKLIFSIAGLKLDPATEKMMVDELGALFKNPDNVSSLGKLLVDDDINIMDIFTDISNKWPDLVKTIAKNSKHEGDFLKKLGRILFDKGVIGKLIPMLAKTDLDLGPLIKGLIHGFSSSEEWMKALPSLDSGIKNIISVIIKNIYDLDGMVLNTLLKIEPEKIKTFVKVFKHGLRSLDVNEMKIFLGIVGIILKGDTIKIPGADGITKIFDRLAPNPDVNDATKNLAILLWSLTR